MQTETENTAVQNNTPQVPTPKNVAWWYHNTLGVAVVPLIYKGKNPPKGVTWTDYQKRKPTDDEIFGWFDGKTMDDINFGIITGNVSGDAIKKDSCLVVVDLDTPQALEWFYSQGWDTDTVTAQSGSKKGKHLYYISDIPVGTAANIFKGTIEGVDVRANGGLIVCSPSMHQAGNKYEWITKPAKDGSNFKPIPEGFLELIPKLTGKKQNLYTGGAVAITDEDFQKMLTTPVEKGGRDNECVIIAGKLLGKNYVKNYPELEATMMKWNLDCCKPALSSSDVYKCCNSIYKKHLQQHPDFETRGTKAVGTKEGEIVWDEPLSLVSNMASVKFPMGSIPSPFKEHIIDIADTVQVDEGANASIWLAAMARLWQRKAVVHASNSRKDQLSLYVACVSPSGERKSAIKDLILAPIISKQKQDAINAKDDIKKAAEELDFLKQKLAKCKKERLKDDTNGSKQEYDQIIQQIIDHKDMKPLKYYYDDITPEALVRDLAHNNESGAIFSDEGGIFRHILGSNPKAGVNNIDIFLKGYDAGDIATARITRDSEELHNPCLTMGLLVQKTPIDSMLNNVELENRGLPARFLYSMGESKVGTRFETIEETGLNKEYQAEYTKHMNMMLDLPDEDAPVADIYLSPEARALYVEYHNTIEDSLVKGKKLSDMAAWSSKHACRTCRIAALLHLAIHKDAGLSMPISGETMDKAIDIGYYYINHALTIFNAKSTGSQDFKVAENVLAWIIRSNIKEFTPTEAKINCHYHIKRIEEDFKPAAQLLIDNRIIQVIEYMPNSRDKAKRYAVNPMIFNTNTNTESEVA